MAWDVWVAPAELNFYCHPDASEPTAWKVLHSLPVVAWGALAQVPIYLSWYWPA